MNALWVFLHGINNTPGVWDPVVAYMSPKPPVKTPEYPAVTCIEDIADLLWEQLPDACVLVGHSFGGYVALGMLAKSPERVAGIALVNSHTREDSEGARELREKSATAAESGKYTKLVEAVSDRVYHPDNLGRLDLSQQREADTRDYGPVRFSAHQRACAARPDREALFSSYSGPKIVVASEVDLVIDPEDQRVMAQKCGASFKSISGAGHMLPAEQPVRLAEQLSNWGRSFSS
ncbi:MAG: alpha/beta fold hydrolase [Luminiphilus sp.]